MTAMLDRPARAAGLPAPAQLHLDIRDVAPVDTSVDPEVVARLIAIADGRSIPPIPYRLANGRRISTVPTPNESERLEVTRRLLGRGDGVDAIARALRCNGTKARDLVSKVLAERGRL